MAADYDRVRVSINYKVGQKGATDTLPVKKTSGRGFTRMAPKTAASALIRGQEKGPAPDDAGPPLPLTNEDYAARTSAAEASGPWLQTYAQNRGVSSARLPREITIPIGSWSGVGFFDSLMFGPVIRESFSWPLAPRLNW